MLKVALTGGIACGKSLVGSFFIRLGADVCDADVLAHATLQPGGSAYRHVVRLFGRAILDPRTGLIDRRRLGRRIFSNATERAQLNAVIHPHVCRAWRAWLEHRPPSTRVAVVVVPLLYEGGFEQGWDYVVCVWAPRRLQFARLARRGLTRKEASQRIASQLGGNLKMHRADLVLINNGTRRLLWDQVVRAWQRMPSMRVRP